MRRVRRSRWAVGWWPVAVLAVCPSSATAGDAGLPDPGRELELLESTEQNEDPLSLDESTGRALDRAAAALPRPRVQVSLPTAQVGAVLSALDGVREQQHAVAIRLDDGLAFVRTRIRLVSRDKHAAELAYRLPLPDDAAVTEVSLCRADACVAASPSAPTTRAPQGGLPGLTATPIRDARGRALALALAPLAPRADIEVRIAFVASAAVHGGRVRFTLPARGEDPRIAPAEVTVSSQTLAELTPGGALESDPAYPLLLTARAARAHKSRVQADCGASPCERRYEYAASAAPDARATWLWVDASPSMEGPARGRAEAAMIALLSELPDQTPLRAYAFAARAAELGTFRAGEAPLAALADATLAQLGAATRPSTALALGRAELARRRPRVVIISDGQLDPVRGEREALRTIRTLGGEPWLVHVGDAPPRFAEQFVDGGVLTVGPVADAALRDGDFAPLADTVRAVAMPKTRGLRAGEARVDERRARGRYPLIEGAHWLSYWLARREPPPSWSTPSVARGTAIAAPPFVAAAAPLPLSATGLPKESVLSMLRTQLVPEARACLRTDRRGRADYALELTFHALFAQREVFDARVEGALPSALRRCLEGVLTGLRVPAFTGRIRVHYPIHTEREAPPPVVELEPELARELERALEPSRALP